MLEVVEVLPNGTLGHVGHLRKRVLAAVGVAVLVRESGNRGEDGFGARIPLPRSLTPLQVPPLAEALLVGPTLRPHAHLPRPPSENRSSGGPTSRRPPEKARQPIAGVHYDRLAAPPAHRTDPGGREPPRRTPRHRPLAPPTAASEAPLPSPDAQRPLANRGSALPHATVLQHASSW